MKMKMIVAGLFTVAFAMIMAAPVQAGRSDHYIHDGYRIHHGVVNGSLTYWETRAPVREQHHINHYKHAIWYDGVLTPRERERIIYMDKRADHHIHHLKHNGWHR